MKAIYNAFFTVSPIECAPPQPSCPQLAECLGKSISIFVKTLTGMTITTNVGGQATIGDVKNAVRDIGGFPVDEQRLIFGSELLEDIRTVADYGIGYNSVLHVVMKLRGC